MSEPTSNPSSDGPITEAQANTAVRLTLALLLLAAVAAVAWLGWLAQASRTPRVGAPSEDRTTRPAPHPYDSSEASQLPHHTEGHGPELAIDGRTAGVLPFAWRPQTYDARIAPGLGLSWPLPQPLSGLRILLSEPLPEPTAIQLTIGADQRSITLTDRETWIGLEKVTPALFVQLTLPKSWPESVGVAELEPLYPGQRAWLVTPSGKGDWEAELLLAYGARTLQRATFATDPQWVLSRAQVLVLADHLTPEAWRQPIGDWVQAGGTLVELAPDAHACPGLSMGSPRLPPDTLAGPVLQAEVRWPGSLVFLGHIEHANDPYRTLITTTGQAASPVLTHHTRGKGSCLRWWGDVAEVVRTLRQGKPALADRDTNGKEGVQPHDLFEGTLTRADYDRPSADLLGFVLAALVSQPAGVMAAPLPPGAPSVLVMTGDQDFMPDAALLAQAQALAPKGAMTAMLTSGSIGASPDVRTPESPEHFIDRSTALELSDQGHDLGVHPNLWKLKEGPEGYRAAIQAHVDGFRETFHTAPRMVRNHHLVWSGYVAMARHHASAKLAMNFDYVSQAFLPNGELGYMASGAVPVRFGDPEGRVVPILQQPTQLDDHVLLPKRFGYRPTTIDQLMARSQHLLTLAIDHHTPLVVNHHPVWWIDSDGAWQRALGSMAQAAKVPVWSGGQWLRFVEGQRSIRVWCTAPGSCTVWTTAPHASLLVSADGGSVRVKGQDAAVLSHQTLGGQRWSLLELADPGIHTIEVTPP